MRRRRKIEYRRKGDKDPWHWCENCSNWPSGDREVRHTKPTSDRLCDECEKKEKAGNCKYSI